MNKEKRIQLKKFDIVSDTSAIVYLQELITRLDKLLFKYKLNLEKFTKSIETIEIRNVNKSEEEIKVQKDLYHNFLSLLSGDASYALNIIGDSQKASLSYFKFRAIIDKRILKNSLSFEIRALTAKQRELLNTANRLRNWSNHIPETLLTAQIELIKKGKLNAHSINPILVHYDNYVTLSYFKNFHIECSQNYELFRAMHQSMKKDYSSIIGESVRIIREHSDIATTLDLLEPTILAHDISFPKKN